jgi:hypothetical protein
LTSLEERLTRIEEQVRAARTGSMANEVHAVQRDAPERGVVGVESLVSF